MFRLCGVVATVVAIGVLAACASNAQTEDRTGGRALEMLWTSADRTQAMYFEIGRDGRFASGGGILARARNSDYETQLDDADIAAFTALLDTALDPSIAAADSRADSEGSDRLAEPGRFELVVTRDGRSERITRVGTNANSGEGADSDLGRLLAFLRRISLRRFDPVIEAQPSAGERFK